MPDTTPTPHPDFRAVFEAMPSACLLLAPDLTVVAVNDAYLRATMTRREAIVGRPVFAVVPGGSGDPGTTASGLRASLERVLATRCPDVMPARTYAVRRPPDLGGGVEERSWSLTNTPVLDDGGTLTWIIHRLEDATERERGATAAGRTAVLNSVGDGFIVMDRDFRLLAVNHAVERLDGRCAADLVGRTHWEAWPASVGTPAEEHYRRAMRERVPVAFEGRCVGPGHDAWLETRAYPCEEGLAVLHRDITDRKRIEEELRESEARFRDLADNAPVMVWVTEPDGRCSYLSKTWYAVTGQTPETGLGFGWLDAVNPEDRGAAERLFLEASVTRTPARIEYRLRRFDGDDCWVIDVATPRFGEGGRFLGFVGSIIDITERRRAEQEAGAARDAAEKANRAKSRFLAAASHDLRQPMQSLLLFLEVLRPHVGPNGQEALKHLGRGLDALNELLDSLLDVSRLDAGVVQPAMADFAVEDLIGQIGAAYTPVAAARGIAFQTAACPVVVHSDRTLLGQMVRNLVDNALRYTETGRIGIECRQTGDRVHIEVHDTGIGIPPEHLEQIWEEFHQVGNPERDRNRGLGLGLAIVQRLSNLLGHPVQVRSQPGEGSVFSIEVPLGKAAPAPPPVRATEAAGNGRFVVLVDDDAIVLLGLKAIFDDWGYEVLAAGSTDRALAALKTRGRRPDIVIADYRLREGRNGTETILGVRAAYGTDVPGIILTGETGTAAQDDATAHGFHLIHKPVTPRQLGQALEAILPPAAKSPR